MNGGNSNIVDIYPLRCYYFSSKTEIVEKDDSELNRIHRMRSNYAARGLRICVEGVLLVELSQQPHVLLLQVKNAFFKLPGGHVRPGESEVQGLKRKLSKKLSHIHSENSSDDDWQIGECLGMWWRSDFETLPYPFLPPSSRRPKECIKLFLVKLPANRKLYVPKNMKLLALPFCQIHDNCEVYGPIISGIPQLLSKFSFNIVEDRV